jgi:cytochrome o ubiquinol oxidase subunit 2
LKQQGKLLPAALGACSPIGDALGRIRFITTLPFIALLCGCHAVVLDPSGDVAKQQRDLLIDSTVLMLIVIVPVMVMTVLFAWRYRQSNRSARYEPDWDHSLYLELFIWAAPLLIIIGLGGLAWVGTHLLDPYRALGRIKAGESMKNAATTLQVDVVALDWKWLFIYPQYGIATVNELAAPVDRPIEFRITADSVMNSLFIPSLAGQIYAMPGMETRLHAVANTAGDYQGFSANYSGAGFSGMRFVFRALPAPDFERWLTGVRTGGDALRRSDYLRLTKPSENEPTHGYAVVEAGLYRAILNRCVEPDTPCISDMMAVDATSGLDTGGATPMADAAPPTGPMGDGPLVGAGLLPPTRVFGPLPPPISAMQPVSDR